MNGIQPIPWAPLAVWLPVLVGLIILSVRLQLTATEFALTSAAGVMSWTLFEYLMHRCLFHWERDDWVGRCVQRIHGKHHDSPGDLHQAIVPPFNAFVILLPVVAMLSLLLPWRLLPAFVAAFVSGYLGYEYLHVAIHRRRLHSKLGQWLQRNHIAHHGNGEGRFGVTSPIWDFVLGTRRVAGHHAAEPETRKGAIIARSQDVAIRVLIFGWFLGMVPAECAEKALTAPPQGIAISAAQRSALMEGLEKLTREIAALSAQPKAAALLPDVQIFQNAVQYALEHEMFYHTNDASAALNLLRQGMERATALREGRAPWADATGLIVRGFVSDIDRSVQPYGLVVPPSFSRRIQKEWRLDFWLHGRDNTLSEVRFLADRMSKPGPFAPPDTFVLHPYGRYCNAFKFAGEVDCLEAQAHVQRHYPIDSGRLCMRGFSMGGAGAWHMGAHHASRWAVVAPGAGFVDTAIYQNLKAKEPKPQWWEEKLWHLYDVPDYAANLANTTVVAYSGEEDPQKQAAQLMEAAMAREGMKMTHVVGPRTGHKYEPGAKAQVERLVDAAAAKGRDASPKQVKLVTWTLRYPTMDWVTLQGLEEHWKEARVDANREAPGVLVLKTINTTALTLRLPPGPEWREPIQVRIDGQTLSGRAEQGSLHLRKVQSRWTIPHRKEQKPLAKLPGLQGPIDDAFYSAFIMVRPTGPPMNNATGAWVQREMDQAIGQWHRQFRGRPRVKKDTELTDEDIAGANLVLWGDASSNRILNRISRLLPVRWTPEGVQIGDRHWSADRFVPVLIYPNPLNMQRYVVVNSGFTFSEFGAQSNAQQVPKLPDYAVLDMSVPAGRRPVSGVAHAGFFGEHWELTRTEGRPVR